MGNSICYAHILLPQKKGKKTKIEDFRPAPQASGCILSLPPQRRLLRKRSAEFIPPVVESAHRKRNEFRAPVAVSRCAHGFILTACTLAPHVYTPPDVVESSRYCAHL